MNRGNDVRHVATNAARSEAEHGVYRVFDAESGGGVDLVGEALGTPVLDAGDFTTEARWNSGDDTLLFSKRLDGWGIGDEELLFSALFSCSGAAQ